MSSTGRAPRGGGEHDFFPTPSWVTRALLAALPLPGGVWLEPAVGGAAIVQAVEHGNARATRRWLGVDIRDVRGLPYLEPADLRIGDFLDAATIEGLPAPDVIITNPPFIHAARFAQRCLDIAAGRAWVCLLLRMAFLESAERAPFLRRHPPDLFPLSERPSFTNGTDTDSTAYGWFVWPPGEARGRGVLHPPIGKLPAGAQLSLGAT
jgi:hypothetical protein